LVNPYRYRTDFFAVEGGETGNLGMAVKRQLVATRAR